MSAKALDNALPVHSAIDSAVAFGLYRASDFRITTGLCTDSATIPQALWYFREETIAVPRSDVRVAAFAKGVSTTEDLRLWLAGRAPNADPEYPPLIWIAAPDVVSQARLSADASALQRGATTMAASLTPRIALNRSYFDSSSAAFLSSRLLSIRGRRVDGGFLMRTLWPEDFRIPAAPPALAFAANLASAPAWRSLVRSEPAGGARSPFAVSTLWQRDPGSPLSGHAVLGLMLNGAQGDDDEAHAGHFALVTGRMRDDGAIGDWLVNNFYALDAESEKGIVAAPVPLDNYLADLNSGQGWYRPSQMLVAVLADDRAPALVQGALNRVYNQFWRHQLVYRHATMNCTGISIDVLRATGWDIPARGAASRLLAAVGFPYFAARERSIAKASVTFDYLTEDMTRLMPAAAFEETSASLYALAEQGGRHPDRSGMLAQLLGHDLRALLLVRFPQFPSSRAFGDAPAVTPFEFHARMPADPALLQVVPVPPRPFPEELRDDDLLPAKRPPSAYAAAIWGVLLLVGIPVFVYRRWQRWRNRRLPT